MLVIRKEQMRIFSTAQRENFERRIQDNLLSCCPDLYHSLGEERVRGIIHDGVDLAASYGISKERHVATFLACILALGEDFQTHPAYTKALPTLRDENLTAAQKVDLLTTAVRSQLSD